MKVIKLSNTTDGLALGAVLIGSKVSKVQRLSGVCSGYFIMNPIYKGHAREDIEIDQDDAEVCIYAAMRHNARIVIKDGYTGLTYRGTITHIKNRPYIPGGDSLITRVIGIQSNDGSNYIGVSIWEHNCEVKLDIDWYENNIVPGVEIADMPKDHQTCTYPEEN